MKSNTLECPRCGEKLPYANAKVNADKSVRIWRRICRACNLVVVDTGTFVREVEDRAPGPRAHAAVPPASRAPKAFEPEGRARKGPAPEGTRPEDHAPAPLGRLVQELRGGGR